MRKCVGFILVNMLLCCCLQAQSLDRQVIGSAGNFATALWGSLSSTTGEMATATLNSTSIILTQGFQQPSENAVRQNILLSTYSSRLYPNPASDNINLIVNTSVSTALYTVSLFNVHGQMLDIPIEVTETNGTGKSFAFDLHSLAAASYFIMITGQGMTIETISFTKIK